MKRKAFTIIISLTFVMTTLTLSTTAAPAKPQLLNDPIDGQILP